MEKGSFGFVAMSGAGVKCRDSINVSAFVPTIAFLTVHISTQ